MPFAGGGGGGGGTTLTADIVWTSNGVLTTSNLAIQTRCQSATAHTTETATSVPAAVTGSLDLLADVTDEFGSIDDSRSTTVIAAGFPPSCFSV